MLLSIILNVNGQPIILKKQNNNTKTVVVCGTVYSTVSFRHFGWCNG